MKKLLLTLIVSLAFCGSIFAQRYQTHWPGFYDPDYSDQGAIAAAFSINGHVYTIEDEGWDALEVCAFVTLADGTEQQRSYGIYLTDFYVLEYGDPYLTSDADAIYYNTPGDPVHFKLFDHRTGIEYDACEITYMDDPLTILTGEDHMEVWDSEEGTPEFLIPVILNFTSSGIDLTIDAYAYNNPSNEGGYCLISSPVGEVDPENVTNMKANSYDLYSFDLKASDGLEWLNYKAGAFDALQPGWGYLYANSGNGTEQTVTLTFPGSAFTTEDGTYTIYLAYNADAEFPGKNLVGNPFNAEAYIARDYYVMNGEGTEILPTAVSPETTIAPMQGVFVEATEDGESFEFSLNPIAGGEGGGEMGEDKIVLDLTNGRSVIDRAAVRFGQGRQLHKFQLRENSTKLYFTVDNEDYAIVRSANQGEMPVSFKAEHNGTYTLSVNAEGMNYLHLIDNRTGADVDLLASPSYTFDALTTDYASRFRLVFATGNADDTFAFASNGSFVISNEGPATVQVIDVNGRIMSSENINGSACINVNAAAGVYMIRLINGDNVKVQKVVVK